MKTLIVYYSFTHNNELLAKAIQKRLNCDIYRIEETRKRNGLTILFDLVFNRTPKIKAYPYFLSAYDQCIFIAPIWAGKIASPLKAFLLEEKHHINRYAFITVCGGAPKQKEKLIEGLTKLLEQRPGSVVELWVNDLLQEKQKNTVKYTSGYRIQLNDLDKFNSRIEDFVKGLESSNKLKQVV